MEGMETKFNRTLRTKKKFSLRPDWQERLPLRAVLIATACVLLLAVLVLVNRPTETVLNSAEMDMVRSRGMLYIGVDTDVAGLYENGSGLEAIIGTAVSERIFEEADHVTFVETDRYSAPWRMADGQIDLALVSMPSFSGSDFSKSDVPFYTDTCVLMGYETGGLAGKTIAVLQETPCQELLYRYMEAYEPELVVRECADYYSMMVMLRSGSVDAVCMPKTVADTMQENRMRQYGDLGSVSYYAIAPKDDVLLELCSELFYEWEKDGTLLKWQTECGLIG